MKKYFLLLVMFALAISGYSQTVLVSEGFETPPYAFTSSGSPTWGPVTNLYYEGTHSYRNQVGASATSYLTTTNSFSTTGNSYVALSFAHICKIEVADTAYIEVSVDGGTTWQKLTTTHYEGSGSLINGYAFNALSYNPDWQPLNPLVAPTNDWWKVETFNISSIAANQSDVKVRFVMKDGNATGSGGAAGWYLDDIKIQAAASELTPPTITLLSPIYEDTVLNNPGPYTVKANITDASGIQTARMIWSINGGTPDSVDMTNTSGSTYEATIPAQVYNTHIDYTIKAIDNSSAHNVATLSKWFFTKRLLEQDITIGTGTTTTGDNPVNNLWGYNYTQQIYTAAEITAAGGTSGGQIYKIKFHWNGTGNLTDCDTWTVYMGNTSKTSFSSTSDWVPLSSMTEVYTGQVTLPPSAGWVTITLTTPFTWDGSNLVIAVDENVPSYGSKAYWYATSTSSYQAIYYRSDSNNPNPASPPTASGRSYDRPNVQLTFEIPSNDNDVQFISITEPSGVLYSTNQYDIKGNFKNLGNNTLTSFTIKYKINGVEQTPYNWTGTMLTDEVREITFATGVSFSAGPVVIEAWTESPNGVTDENQSNDTANVSLHCCTAGFSGTYTIDSSQPTGGTNFNNVADAFTEIGTCGIVGPVTIELVDTLYQGSIILGELPGLSPTNTLTIKPQNGKQVTIESDATYYTIQLLATHDIIIDGSGDGSGSRDLTIKHTATSGSHTPIHIASSGVGQGCERITIKNVNIEAGRNGSTTSGIFIGGSTSATASGEDNDSIVIDNVNIQKAYYGIYAYGKSANPAKRIYITNSSFGSDSTDSFITQRGVYLYYANNVLVNNNHIYNITTSSSTPQGIYLYHIDTATVMNNLIHSVKYTGTAGYGGHGIEAYYSDNALIANNMIYDMQGDGYTTITGSSMAGIVIRYSNINKVYFNSVNLFGDYNRSSATITSAFFADANSSELDIRNNIFVNSMINTGNTSAKAYAIYSLASPSAYTYLDYNDYYVSGLQGVLGYFNDEDQTTLASLQAATGKDAHSLNIDPEFISNTDLHTFNADLSSVGTPIPDITTDIDGDPRYPMPSIGADEVELLPINLKLSSIDNTIHGCEYSGSMPVSFTVVNMGTDQITTFDAAYILDGATPVTQSYTTNLNSFDTAQFTFSTNITNLDPNIEHSLRVYVSCDNDANRNNDTLDIMISDVYDLVASPYTMSFELTEPYGYFSALDLGNDGYSWVFPSTGDEHSGSNSAVYNNSTTNTHGDWLFSRCFELTAGETYEVSFWYKASSASDNHVMYLGISPTPNDTINLINIDNISAINNTTYSQHTKRFIAPTTGTYYIGWGMYSPHANNKLYIDDINISWIPAQDIKMLEVTSPVTDCGLGVESITVKGQNIGTNDVSNFPISYQIAGNPSVVTETYTGTVAAGQEFTYTFAATEDFSAPIQDLDVTIIAWSDLSGDPISYNDTIEYSFTSRFTPIEPVVHNETILAGTSATLAAYNEAPAANNIWYSDMLGNNILGTGNTYTTPILSDTTIYYVLAASATGPIIIGDMNSPTTTYYIPFYGYYDYGYSSMIYLSSEIGQGGLIDTIAFYVTNAPTNYIMMDQRIYIKERTESAFFSTETSLPDTTNMTRVFKGNITFNGSGWHKIALQTPFNYSGSNNLQIAWINNDGDYVSGYPYFMSTTTSSARGLYKYQDNSFPTTGGTLVNYYPNIRLSLQGCSSGIVADTVFVVDSTEYELAIDDVVYPENIGCVTPTTNVSIRLRNDGYEDIPAGVDLTCIVNGTTLTGTTTEPILADSTIDYTFTTPININFIEGEATLDFKVYHSAPQYSLTVFNDTLLKSIRVLYQPDAPVAHSCVTLAGLPALLSVDPQTPISHYWFSDSLASILLHVGDTFMTQPLYDTTVYYVSTSTDLDPIIIGDMASTTTTNYIPFYGLYDYGYSSMIYLSSEIGQGGLIDTIAFYVTNSPTNYLMLDQRVYITETSAAAHSSSDFPDTTSMQRVFKGDMTFDGTGWHKVALQTPFNYSGTNNLQIVWLNYDGDYVSGYPSFKTTTVTGNRGLYKYQDNSFPTSSGTTVTYIPNMYVSISGCSSDIVADTAYVLPSAQYELAIEEIVSPTADGCSQPNTNVTVRLHNYGVEAIPVGVELTCIENDTNIISESIHDEILPNEDYYFTFTNPINITYLNGVANVNLKIYHDGAPTYSPVIYNDTIAKTFRLYERAANPIVASSTIDFGDIDTLVASSPSGLPIYWYSDPYGSNVLNVGDTLITPHLLDTTIYYVSSGPYSVYGINPKEIGDMNSTTTTYYIPFYGYYNYGYSSMIYLSSEIGGGGLIDTIAFYVTNDPSNYQVLDQRIYFKERTTPAFGSSETSLPDTTTMTRVFKGNITFNGNGWHKIPLQTPFYYTGNNHLQITYINNDGSYESGYPYFKKTDVTGNRGLYKYQDASLPTTDGTLVTYVPNIYISISGCSSELVADTVYVINFPQYELAVEQLVYPIHGACTEENVNIKVRLHNYGYDTIPAGASITCVMDGTDTITDITSDEILPHSDYIITFTSPLTIPFVGGQATIDLEIYPTDLTYSTLTYNDTISRTLNLRLQPEDPIAINDTVPLLTSATLTAIHQAGTDILWYIDSLATNPFYIGDTLITDPVMDTMKYYISAATGSPYVRFTEVTLWKNATTGVTPSYPSYIPTSDLDLLEITNLGEMSIDLENYTLIVEGVGARTYTFPSITLDGGDIMIVNIGSGTDDFANLYLNTGGANNDIMSTNQSGFILKDEMNNIVDAVAVNGYTFSPASGVTPSDWSGNIPSASSKAGVIRVVADNNTADDWIVADATNPQSIGYMNPYFTGTFGSGCQSYKVPIYAYPIYPPYELAVEELIAPAAGECIETNTNVTVKLKNYGTDAIPAGVDLTCVLNGTDTINGTTTEQILPNSTIDFTFPAFLTIPFIGGHASVELEVYHNNPAYSTITNNDTLLVDVNLMQKPDNPIVASQTINYGEMATLTATSPSGVPIVWYSDPLGQNMLHVGNTYITPRIYSNTIYYLAAVSAGDVIVGDMNSTSETNYLPTNGWYNYSYSSMIYLSSEIGQGGLIDTIAFYVTNNPSNYQMLDQRVYITETALSSHSSSDFPDTTTMQRVFIGDLTFNGNGWHKVALQTPFNYLGTDNLQIVWLNYDGSYSSGYPKFKYTNVTGNRGLYKYQDGSSFPTTSGTLVTYVPNIYLSISGCSSEIVSDTVYVTNMPDKDVGIAEITKPSTGIELTDEEVVKVVIRNFTQNDLNNATFDVAYQIDNQVPVVEQFTGSIAAQDTVSFTFTQTVDLSIIGNTYSMIAYTDYDLDGFIFNDTLQKSITNNPLEYCTSAATSTGDEDICRFMLADLDNTSGYTSALYTDFTNLPAPVLFIGQDYPLEIEVCDNPSYYYAGYARVFIDWNHDGEYQVPDEVVFESSYPAQPSTLLSDSITVPTDAYIGYTGMRVIVREGSVLPDPCGTYGYGETEDYLVLVLPRKAIDAGISAANVGYAQYNGTTTTAEVKVRNYGYNPLTNFNIIAKKDAQVISTTPWSGNLLPDSSIIINIPNLPVDSGLNNVCFTVQTLNDSVPQNDTRCAQYFGLPSVILFEDDMEPTTLLTADATGMWEHGVPQGTVINHPYSAPNVWMTKLATPYPNDTIGYLEFPVQNFSGVTDPYLSFYYWVESESGKDGAYIEYSLNNGQTWLTLGGINDPDGYHWYTDYLTNGKPGYSGSSNGWVGAFIKMSALSNKTNVRLRIGFVSDATVNADGFAIDNIVISAYNVPNNVALAEIVTPTSPTTTGSTQTVKVKIANVGTNVVTNVPVSYKIDGGTAVNGTYSGSINPGDTVEYTFTQTYLAPHIDYTLCAYSRYPSDIVRINDTLCMNIQSLPADYDIGVVEIISPSDSTPIGQQIAVTIAVKNYGLNPVSNVPVRYQLNYANDRNDVISQTINPGDTIHFTFTQKYNGPTIQYVLCAETQLSNDMYTNNDAICEVLGTYVVGIEDILAENDGIVLYPNPSTGELNILLETTKASEGTLIIRNPLGELVYSENISVNAGRNELRLDLTHQAAGLYHCTVMLGDKVYNRVISIQK